MKKSAPSRFTVANKGAIKEKPCQLFHRLGPEESVKRANSHARHASWNRVLEHFRRFFSFMLVHSSFLVGSRARLRVRCYRPSPRESRRTLHLWILFLLLNLWLRSGSEQIEFGALWGLIYALEPHYLIILARHYLMDFIIFPKDFSSISNENYELCRILKETYTWIPSSRLSFETFSEREKFLTSLRRGVW